MSANPQVWVLGHKIRTWDTDESYGLIEVTSLPKVPGPPPHLHKHEREFFFIVKGELDVMANGSWSKAAPGTFLELPPETVHTFINNAKTDAVWITGWRPKGFERFFRDFGIPVDETGAMERSVSPEIVTKVVERCERYGMYAAR
jgi:mannose-6-phosphate isomerase-like protein (cupin superfamily)